MKKTTAILASTIVTGALAMQGTETNAQGGTSVKPGNDTVSGSKMSVPGMSSSTSGDYC